MELTVLSPQDILGKVDQKLKILPMIARDSGLSADHCQKFITPVILGLAKSVLSAPLSREFYAYENGALEYGLISSMLALRIAEGSIFTQGTVEDRALYEPQYKYACFCAAIASVPAFLYSGVSISNLDGEIWSPLQSDDTLAQWLNNSKTFHANWYNKIVPISRMFGAAMSWKIFPKGVWGKFDQRIVVQMFDSINPPETPMQGESKITSIVRKAHEKAIDLYHQSNEHRFIESAASPNEVGISDVRANIKADELLLKTRTGQNTNISGASKPIDNKKFPSLDFKQIDPATTEFFSSITADSKYASIKKELIVSDKGVELPLKFIAYGLEVRGTIRLLEANGLIVEKRNLQSYCTPM